MREFGNSWFHATAPTRLGSILRQGIRSDAPSPRGGMSQAGVSVSTDFNELSGRDFGSLVLVLDPDRVGKDLEVTPFDYWGDGREAELRLTDPENPTRTVVSPGAITDLVFLTPSLRRYEVRYLRQHGLPIWTWSRGELNRADEDAEGRVVEAVFEALLREASSVNGWPGGIDISSVLRDRYDAEVWMREPKWGDEFEPPIAVIDSIVVPQSQRGQGTGSAILQDLADWADEHGIIMTLTPSSDFGGTVKRLKRLYARFGFVSNSGRNKDFRSRDVMIRYPRS